uniref:Uncharacterized protein n=1 Tax=Arundo donax TaxID=35708 RepID=A0A0A9FDX6_ARUDO
MPNLVTFPSFPSPASSSSTAARDAVVGAVASMGKGPRTFYDEPALSYAVREPWQPFSCSSPRAPSSPPRPCPTSSPSPRLPPPPPPHATPSSPPSPAWGRARRTGDVLRRGAPRHGLGRQARGWLRTRGLDVGDPIVAGCVVMVSGSQPEPWRGAQRVAWWGGATSTEGP